MFSGEQGDGYPRAVSRPAVPATAHVCRDWGGTSSCHGHDGGHGEKMEERQREA